jgi:ABC-type nitrate/sulfonate/bicarbonate transport system substrate-binding protein
MLMNRSLVLACALWAATLVAGQVAAAAEEKVRFSVAAITGSYMDEFVAIEKGYHREEGLARWR